MKRKRKSPGAGGPARRLVRHSLGDGGSLGAGGTTILIVEDDNDLRESLITALSAEGYRALGAANAAAALEYVQKQAVSIILMDICLPEQNGVETFRAIKQIRPAAKTVMMTGFFVPDLVEAALAAGACDILYKPFNLDDVLRMIGKICG